MARKAKQPKGKKMNPTFFVFCEGKTEAAYIDLLRRNYRVPVEIIAKISDSNISQPYIDRCLRQRFSTSNDKIFLMFDLDVAGMLEHLKSIRNSTLLLSNPCIEYWFLLHYRDTAKELTSPECIRLLKNFEAEYDKGGFTPNMMNILIGNIEIASERAKAKPLYLNPSSTFHIFVEELKRLKKVR